MFLSPCSPKTMGVPPLFERCQTNVFLHHFWEDMSIQRWLLFIRTWSQVSTEGDKSAGCWALGSHPCPMSPSPPTSMFSSHPGPSAAPPFSPRGHYTRKGRPHARARRASEPVRGQQVGDEGGGPGAPGSGWAVVPPESPPSRPLRSHSGPRLAPARLRSDRPLPSSPAPPAQAGRAPPAPHPRRPRFGPPHSQHVRRRLLPVLSALEAARRARNTSPGPLPPPPRLRPASSFPSKAAK